MKKYILYTCVALSAAACNNNVKTEEQEKHERDSMDNIQLDKNQLLLDSIMKAQESPKSNSTPSKGSESIEQTK